MTTGKTIALTRWTLAGKVNSSSYPPSKKQNLTFHKEARTLWDPQGHTVLHPSQISTSLWTQWSLPLGMESSRTPFVLIQSSLPALSTGQCILVFSTHNATNHSSRQNLREKKWNRNSFPRRGKLSPKCSGEKGSTAILPPHSTPKVLSTLDTWLLELNFC